MTSNDISEENCISSIKNKSLKERLESQKLKYELSTKDILYTLFYEIKSEIIGSKIEIDEDEYQENIKMISIQQIIDYIHQAIQILINKKIDDTKKEQGEFYSKIFESSTSPNNKKNNKADLSDKQMKMYENLLINYESKERSNMKKILHYKIQKNILENKLSEYMEMEEDFEEMKCKFKYEDGRFLENDRKDNEIIIIRKENSILKENVKALEGRIYEFEAVMKKKDEANRRLKEEIERLTKNLEEKQNELNLVSNINININTKKSNSKLTTNCNNLTTKKNSSNLKNKNLIKNIVKKIELNKSQNSLVKEEISSLSLTSRDPKTHLLFVKLPKKRNEILRRKNNNKDSFISSFKNVDFFSNTKNNSKNKSKNQFLYQLLLNKSIVNQNNNNTDKRSKTFRRELKNANNSNSSLNITYFNSNRRKKGSGNCELKGNLSNSKLKKISLNDIYKAKTNLSNLYSLKKVPQNGAHSVRVGSKSKGGKEKRISYRYCSVGK